MDKRIITKNPEVNQLLKKLQRNLDILIAIQLAKSGLSRKEVADVLEVSEKTVERMIPFGKIRDLSKKLEKLKNKP